MSHALSRGAIALVLLLSAVGLLASLPLGWGAADAPDGTRFKVSPLGLSHVLEPHQTVSPTEDCRWGSGDPLCATRAEAAGAVLTLRAVPWLVRLAALVALIGAGTWFLSGSRVKLLRRAAIVLPALLTGLALAGFAWSVPRAALALAGLDFGVGGTLATLQLSGIIVVLLGVTAVGVVTGGGWARGLLGTTCAGLAAATFLLMFPPIGGLAFAAAGFAAGAGLGFAARRFTGAPAGAA